MVDMQHWQEIIDRLKQQWGLDQKIEQRFAQEQIPPPLSRDEWYSWLMNWTLSLLYQGVMEEQPELLVQIKSILPAMSELYALGARVSESFPTYPAFLLDWDVACLVAKHLRDLVRRRYYGGLERQGWEAINRLREVDEALDSFVEERFQNEGMPKPYSLPSWCAWLINTACVMIFNQMFDFAIQEIDTVAQLHEIGVRQGGSGEFPAFPAKRFPTFPLLAEDTNSLYVIRMYRKDRY